jgi:hypothetical protein
MADIRVYRILDPLFFGRIGLANHAAAEALGTVRTSDV